MSAIVGPVAPFNNVPIHAEYFQPSRFVISAINLGQTTTITTTENMNYVVGQLIRLLIPPSFGCRQLNNQTGYVISLPAANQIQVNINSSQNVDPFVASSATTTAQVVSIGDVGNGIISATGLIMPTTNIPGSFINISP